MTNLFRISFTRLMVLLSLFITISCAKNKELVSYDESSLTHLLSDEHNLEDLESSIEITESNELLLLVPDISLYSSIVEGRENITEYEYFYEMKEFNVPIVMTPRVQRYIKYFTEKIPKVTQKWLDRANKYMYVVEDVFLEAELPSDLVALAFTESGFNNHAISRVGATGMWQFMPSTGRMYGMKNDFWVDERRDFEISSRSAARFLSDLYKRFDDWFLALAAYNAGPGRIHRASVKHKTDDFFKIASTRTLALETRDYVPKFIALLIIYKNYLKFGFEAPKSTPLFFSKIDINSQVNLFWLSEKLNIKFEDLIELNPSLKVGITPPVKTYSLRVPYGRGNEVLDLLSKTDKAERLQYTLVNVKGGANIKKLAKKYGVSLSRLKDINCLDGNTVLQSKPLLLPISKYSDKDMDKGISKLLNKYTPKYYVVRSGDTFIAIAHKHGMKTTSLKRLNPRIGNVHKLRIGQKIVIKSR